MAKSTRALLVRPCDEPGWLAPLFVHYSDDESRSELLDAAFPAAAGWRVACSHVDDSHSDWEAQAAPVAGWGAYRLQVCAHAQWDRLQAAAAS